MRASVLAVLVVAFPVWGQGHNALGPRGGGDGRAEAQFQPPRNAETSRSPNATAAVTMAVVREFTGHPDFPAAGAGSGRHAGIVSDRLDGDDKPEFVSRGYRVLRPGRDATGEAIMAPRRYIQRWPGDQAPRVEFVEGRAVESAESLSAWYRDVTNVNSVSVRQVEFRLAETGTETETETETDAAPSYVAEVDLAGDDRAPGSSPRPRTLELTARFVHRHGAGDRLRCAAADDLWVFIDGWLVIDLGGSGGFLEGDEDGEHEPAVTEQSIDLDRLPWLRDGEEYVVKVFGAARRGGPAPVRIEAPVAPGGAAAPALAAGLGR